MERIDRKIVIVNVMFSFFCLLFSAEAQAKFVKTETITQTNIPTSKKQPLPAMHFSHDTFRPIFDLGFVFGVTNNDRVARVRTNLPEGDALDHNTKFIQELGVDFKVLFGALEKTQPFFYLNADRMLGSTNDLFEGITTPTTIYQTKITLQNPWVTRLGIGCNSKPFFINNSLRAGAGIALAAIQQTLSGVISDIATTGDIDFPILTNILTPFTLNQTTFQPSVMGSLTWEVCRACFQSHPIFLAGQIIVDRYPGITTQVTSVSGSVYTVSVNQRWQTHEYIILGVHL